MERNRVDSWCIPNFTSSSCASQCFPCRCTWLLPMDWQCLLWHPEPWQMNGVYMPPQAPLWLPTHCTLYLLSFRTCWFCCRLYWPWLLQPRWRCLLWHRHHDGPYFHGDLLGLICSPPPPPPPPPPTRLTVLDSTTLPHSAAPPAELPGCTCDCATLLRDGLPLPVTRLNSGDLRLALPESPLA